MGMKNLVGTGLEVDNHDYDTRFRLFSTATRDMCLFRLIYCLEGQKKRIWICKNFSIVKANQNLCLVVVPLATSLE